MEKTFSSLNFWKHGAVNEFYGATDISFQMRVARFPVILGLEKPKMLHTGTCASTSTRHVTLKYPLLLQFPYRELCDNDHKQSNYRRINVLFCTRALFPGSPIQCNKRQKKETLGFSHGFFAYMHLSKREISIPSKKPRNFFTFFSFRDQSS